MTRRTLLVPLFAAACILAPSQLSGQVTPLAGPFEVSPQTYGLPNPGSYGTGLPAVTALADGSFMVAWEQRLEDNPPDLPSGTFYDLYARKVSANGTPGRLVRVDRGTIEADRRPDSPTLAGDGQGGFVLAWERLLRNGADVLFQRVPSGSLLRRGGQVLHPGAQDADRYPAVAANAAGDWVLAWEEWVGGDHLRRNLGIRAFHASGEPATPEIRIEPAGPYETLLQPRVVMHADGSFVVIWGAYGDSAGPVVPRVQGRSFAADGTPLGPVFQVGLIERGIWDAGTIDEESGEFWVAWEGPSSRPASFIRLRRYSREGARLNTRVVVRSVRSWRFTSNRQGDLVFAWVDQGGGVLARPLDRNGVPQAPPFVITQVSDNPWIGDIALSDTGRLLATWASNTEATTPGGASYQPVMGRLWEMESGDD